MKADIMLNLSEQPTNNSNEFGESNLVGQNEFSYLPIHQNIGLSSQSTETLKRSSIYVCTFCQVFSSSDIDIANHIAKEHGHSMKEGTFPGNYVSKLQALKNEKTHAHRKVGRPKKLVKKSSYDTLPIIQEEVPNLVPGPDGQYCCKKCHRYFKKSRQLCMHVCLEIDDQNESPNENEADEDDTADFKTFMDVQPTPWFRRKKRKSSNVESVNNFNSNQDKTDVEKETESPEILVENVSNWRDDPAYVPLFKEENEKQAFEEHLKSINYSGVDIFFEKIASKSKSSRIKDFKTATSYNYICLICKLGFNSLSHIRLHCLTHTDLKPFTCPRCSYKSNAKASLYTHMRTHTGNVFHCSECSFKSTKRSHFLEHQETHSTVPKRCELCKNTYKTLKSLTLHIKRYHNNASGKKYFKSLSQKQINKSLITCNICNKKFKSQSNLEAHKTHVHAATSISKPLSNEKESKSDIELKSIAKEPEVVFENVDFEHASNLPPLLQECSVRIEPLDHELISCLQNGIKCNICDQNFTSYSSLQNHKLLNHPSILTVDQLEIPEDNETRPETSFNNVNVTPPSLLGGSRVESLKELQKIPEPSFDINLADCPGLPPLLECSVRLEPLEELQKRTESSFEDIGFSESTALPSLLECSVRIEPLDDQLVEIMLNNLLQEKNNQPVELFDNVFEQSTTSALPNSDSILNQSLLSETATEKLLSTNDINQFQLSNSSILEECQEKLPMDILDECLRQSNITDNIITEPWHQASKSTLSSQSHQLPKLEFSNLDEMSLNFPNNQLLSRTASENPQMCTKLQLAPELSETKPEEIKLFERCKQAPAYVCCVCSGIFICPQTLKAHLKEHVNSTSGSHLIEDQMEHFNSIKFTQNESALDDVCRILQESSSSDVDKELEKLYTSSLHTKWYLPNVSVVLENDPALFDTFVDMPNFPKFDESESLQLDSELFS